MIITKIITKIKYYINIYKFRKKYRKINVENYTIPNNIFNLNKVKIGKYTYGPINVVEFGLVNEELIIGSYCSIADNVTFLLSGEHSYKRISTYPFKTKILGEEEECICKGKIIIEDDVWIGYGATILSGVKIGQGAIIGAGTVVAKDVPPYAIYVNGKIIKYRFSDEIIEKLKQIDYSKLNKDKIVNELSLLYKDITEENIDELIKKIS